MKPIHGVLIKEPPPRRPTDIATLSYREIAKLITTDLVTHPVSCVIDKYIHTYVHWIIVLGLGGILLNKYSECMIAHETNNISFF